MTGSSAMIHGRDTAPKRARARVALPIVCCTAVLACAAWAAWPLSEQRIEVAPISGPMPRAVAMDTIALDLAPFHAPLWVAPPAPPPSPVAAAPPPPLRLHLIAILRGSGPERPYRAALYDPESDKLIFVGPGDSIDGRTIERVGASELSLLDHGVTRTLSLNTEGGAP